MLQIWCNGYFMAAGHDTEWARNQEVLSVVTESLGGSWKLFLLHSSESESSGGWLEGPVYSLAALLCPVWLSLLWACLAVDCGWNLHSLRMDVLVAFCPLPSNLPWIAPSMLLSSCYCSKKKKVNKKKIRIYTHMCLTRGENTLVGLVTFCGISFHCCS